MHKGDRLATMNALTWLAHIANYIDDSGDGRINYLEFIKALNFEDKYGDVTDSARACSYNSEFQVSWYCNSSFRILAGQILVYQCCGYFP